MKKADLAKFIANIPIIRTRLQKACTGGSAEEIVKRIDLSDIGLQTAGMFARGVPGMCKELAQ
jgi:hypothetical protein